MKALIVAAGDIPSKELFTEKYNQCQLRIAADNGLHVFYKYGLKPDVIIGDFDSSQDDERNYFISNGSSFVELEVEKNMTDTEAAIDLARSRGFDDIVLLGATGKRIDHLISNLTLLNGANENGYNLVIEDNEHEIYVADGEFIIEGFKGQTVSLFPVENSARVCAADGLYYPLDNLLLKNTQSRGVSNILTERSARIATDKPLLIVKIKKEI